MDFQPGPPAVQVRTLNSTYSLQVLGNDLYSVSGGWFDHEGLSPFKTDINGCTWAGPRAVSRQVRSVFRSISGGAPTHFFFNCPQAAEISSPRLLRRNAAMFSLRRIFWN